MTDLVRPGPGGKITGLKASAHLPPKIRGANDPRDQDQYEHADRGRDRDAVEQLEHVVGQCMR